MLFAGGFFLTYFLPVTLLAYWLSPNSLRNMLLLFASIAFYAWGEPVYVFVLLTLTLVNFLLAGKMERSSSRKRWLTAYILLNIGMLVAVKYTGFIVENIGLLTGWSWCTAFTAPELPLGVSFYAFHAITYGVDVYRRSFSSQPGISGFLLYLFLFPHQIAGPIVTYGSIAGEISQRKFDWNLVNEGMTRFARGLAKKVLLANGLAALLEVCEQQSAITTTASLAWVQMFTYTCYIYFDFSGYSDMAIGLGRMFGFHFPENFDKPYTSRSITEFWQRWHISLGYFMRNYLYIPLGGNRQGAVRTYRNLLIVFFISGLWHGASWNFVIWGLFHGMWLVLERLFLGKWLKKAGVLSAAWTFLIVLNGWVFFYCPDLETAFRILSAMWSFDFSSLPLVRDITYFERLLGISTGLLLLGFLPWKQLAARWFPPVSSSAVQLARLALTAVFYIAGYASIAAGSYNPFIYFNF